MQTKERPHEREHVANVLSPTALRNMSEPSPELTTLGQLQQC